MKNLPKILFFLWLSIALLMASDEEMELEPFVVPPIVRNTHITKMDLSNAGFTNIDFIFCFPNLIELELYQNPRLTSIRPLLVLKNIEKLNLSTCCEVRDVELLSNLTTLKKLKLACMFSEEIEEREAVSLAFVMPLTKLRSLDISSNLYIFSIEPITAHPRITHLFASGLHSVQDWDILGRMTRLKELDIHANYMHHRNKSHPNHMHFLKNLVNLEKLTLGRWLHHKKIVADLPKLTDITVK